MINVNGASSKYTRRQRGSSRNLEGIYIAYIYILYIYIQLYIYTLRRLLTLVFFTCRLRDSIDLVCVQRNVNVTLFITTCLVIYLVN